MTTLKRYICTNEIMLWGVKKLYPPQISSRPGLFYKEFHQTFKSESKERKGRREESR